MNNVVQAGELRRQLAEGFLEVWEELDPLEGLQRHFHPPEHPLSTIGESLDQLALEI